MVTYRDSKMFYSGLWWSYSDPKVTNGDSKVTYSDSKVTYSDSGDSKAKVTYSDSKKVTYIGL